MKTSAKIGGVVAAVMLAVSGAAFAADAVNPYVQANGTTLKSGYGLPLAHSASGRPPSLKPWAVTGGLRLRRRHPRRRRLQGPEEPAARRPPKR